MIYSFETDVKPFSKILLYILCVCHDHFHHDIDQIEKMKRWLCFLFFAFNINNSLNMLLFKETQILFFNARNISSEINNKSSSNLCLILYGWEVQAWEMAKLLKKRQSHLACMYMCFLIARSHLSVSNTSCS